MQDEAHGYDENSLDGESRADFAIRMLKKSEGKRLHEYRIGKHSDNENTLNKQWQDEWETANPPPDIIEVT